MSLPLPHEVLPHRDPFLYLDRCLTCDTRHAVAERTFTDAEPFFAGHFPGTPVVPGVILIEGLAQTLAYLALRQRPGQQVLLAGVDKCRIRRPVRPNETVRFEIEVQRARGQMVQALGTATVDGEVAVKVVLRGWITAPE